MRPFEPQEILETIQAWAGDKAPGPDCYTKTFINKGWEVIGSYVIAAVQNFNDQEVFGKSFNATIVALIPKKLRAV